MVNLEETKKNQEIRIAETESTKTEDSQNLAASILLSIMKACGR